MLSFTLPILHFLYLSLCHVGLAKCQFRPQRAKVQKQICVCYDPFLRVFAVGAVFNTCGTRDVRRQHLRQLSGIASESFAHSDETNNSYGLWVFLSCFVCSCSVLLSFSPVWNPQCLRACGQMRQSPKCCSASLLSPAAKMLASGSHVLDIR